MDSSLAVPEYANGTKVGIQQLKEMFEQAERQDQIKPQQQHLDVINQTEGPEQPVQETY
jgi:hypothetical protein